MFELCTGNDGTKVGASNGAGGAKTGATMENGNEFIWNTKRTHLRYFSLSQDYAYGSLSQD